MSNGLIKENMVSFLTQNFKLIFAFLNKRLVFLVILVLNTADSLFILFDLFENSLQLQLVFFVEFHKLVEWVLHNKRFEAVKVVVRGRLWQLVVIIRNELSLDKLALGLDIDDEGRTHANLALHFNVSAHLLDYLFADAQT